MELEEYHFRARSNSKEDLNLPVVASSYVPQKVNSARDEVPITPRTRSRSATVPVPTKTCEISPTVVPTRSVVVFVFREMVQLFASHFGDFASVGRFLCTCKEIFSSPSAPGVWKAVAEKMYKLHRVLPLSFDYTQYIREKIVWTFPINWEAVETSTRPSGRSRAGVTRVGDKVLVVGGHTRHNGEFVRERDIWCFDTETDSYSQITTSENAGPPQISRLCLESFDDTVYSFGGILQDKTKINTVYSFDLTNKEWKAVNTSGTAPTPRCDPITCAYTMNESKKGMIVLGGSQEGLLYYSDVHFFDVVSKTWERVVIDNEGIKR